MEFNEAVEHYYQLKKNDSMSLGDIREELISRHHFREEHAKEIVRQISDRELAEISQEKGSVFSFLDHPAFSYIMIFAGFGVIIFCIIFLIRLYNVDPELRASRYAHIAPYVFIGGAVTLIGKHLLKIKRAKRNKL